MNRLLTIRISHYNEKARWALDRFHVRYREHGYMPIFHLLPVALATWRRSDASADRVSSRFSTPVLITEEGDRICDSSRIVRWASDRHAPAGAGLYPDEECAKLEQRFSESLGGHTRRLAYHWALPEARGVRAVARENVGSAQAALFALLLPVARPYLRRALAIDPEHVEESLRVVQEEVASASRLVEGRRFLVGERFSAADLALACMLAPVLLVSHEEGYGAFLPELEAAHPGAAEFAREIRKTPAGSHAMRMFREERRTGIRPGGAGSAPR